MDPQQEKNSDAQGTINQIIKGETAPLQKPIIRTYEGDVASVLQKKNTSLIKIAIAESKKTEDAEVIGAKPSSNKKNIGILSISIILVVVGVGVLAYIYVTHIYQPKITIENKKTIETLIPVDSYTEIKKISNQQLSQDLALLITSTSLPVGQLENIAVTEQGTALQTEQFLTAIAPKIPSSLLRAFFPTYMVGIHSKGGNAPFIIIKIDSYQFAFAGMLRWEETMYEDLRSYLPKFSPQRIIPQPTILATSTLSSTTPATSLATSSPKNTTASTTIATSSLPTAPAGQAVSVERTTSDILTEQVYFSDTIIRNKDVRVMKDRAGNTLLLYTFIDKGNLLITTNEQTFREVIDRFEKQTYER